MTARLYIAGADRDEAFHELSGRIAVLASGQPPGGLPAIGVPRDWPEGIAIVAEDSKWPGYRRRATPAQAVLARSGRLR